PWRLAGSCLIKNGNKFCGVTIIILIDYFCPAALDWAELLAGPRRPVENAVPEPQEKPMLYAHRKCALLLLTLLSVAWPSFAKDPLTADADKGLLPLEDLRTFTRVYDHIRNGYVDEISDAKLL